MSMQKEEKVPGEELENKQDMPEEVQDDIEETTEEIAEAEEELTETVEDVTEEDENESVQEAEAEDISETEQSEEVESEEDESEEEESEEDGSEEDESEEEESEEEESEEVDVPEEEETHEVEPIREVTARSFGKIFLCQLADMMQILLLLSVAGLLVLGYNTYATLFGIVWILRLIVSSSLLRKAEQKVAKIGIDAQKLYEKSEADKKLYFWTYMISAIGIILLGAVAGVSVYLNGLEYEQIAGIIGLILLTCPAELFTFFKLCRAEKTAGIADTGSAFCPGARAIRDAGFMVIRESDVVSDKLKFSKIDTYYKCFGLKDSVIGRDKPIFRTVLEMAVQATKVKQDENGLYKGDKEELAWINGAASQAVYKETLDEKFTRKFKFKGENTITFGLEIPDGVRLISKGEPSEILAMCDRVMGDGVVHEASEEIVKELTDRAEAYRKEGAHICALAFSDYAEKPKKDTKDKMFLGLLVCNYVPNTSTITAIRKNESIGLRPLLLSRQSSEKTAAMLKLYKEDSVCIIKEEATDEHLSVTDAYCGMTPEKEQQILSVYQQAGKSVLVFVQNGENKHLREHTDASVLVGSKKDAGLYGSTIKYKSDIGDLRKKLSAYLYREKKTLAFMAIVKAFLLVFGLLTSLVAFKSTMYLSQTFVIGLFAEICAMFVLYAPYHKEKYFAQQKRTNALVAIFAGLACFVVTMAYVFGRFTVPAGSVASAEQFASGMSFLVALAVVLLLAMGSMNAKIVLSFSFTKSKQTWLLLLIGAILGAAMLYMPEIRAFLAVPFLPIEKGMWILAFAFVFLVASDLLKYILCTIKEKE